MDLGQDEGSTSATPPRSPAMQIATDQSMDCSPDLDLESPIHRPAEQLDDAGGLLGAIRCRRRAPRDVAIASAQTPYSRLLARGQGLSQDERNLFGRMAWWSEAETAPGVRVLVLVPRGLDGSMDGSVDMWKLLSYVVSELHERVVQRDERYSIVWVQANDHRMWSVSLWRFRRSMHAKYFENVHEVHVVHPSWAARVYALLLWPWAEESFWDRFISHERVEFLSSHLNVEKLMLPRDVADYDEYLDKESHAMSEQAALLVGGDLSYRDTSGLCANEETY